MIMLLLKLGALCKLTGNMERITKEKIQSIIRFSDAGYAWAKIWPILRNELKLSDDEERAARIK